MKTNKWCWKALERKTLPNKWCSSRNRSSTVTSTNLILKTHVGEALILLLGGVRPCAYYSLRYCEYAFVRV